MLPGCTPRPAAEIAHYREQGWWRGETLGDLLHDWAERSGERTALVHDGERVSYRELDRQVDALAAGLRASGIGSHDRVVLQLPSVVEFVSVAFALYRIGAVPVFCLTSHRRVEVEHLIELSGAVGYVIPSSHRGFDHLALARELAATHPQLRSILVRAEACDEVAVDGTVRLLSDLPADATAPAPAPDPGDVAFFLLSGGTTALPKLIPRTHDDYAYQLRATGEVAGAGPDTVYLAALPIEFNFTWGCPGVLGTLAAGGTVVLADDPTPQTCFDLIAAERVTHTSLVPTVARLWLDALEVDDADLSSLRLVQIGGAKLQPELAARIEPELGVRLQQVFGMAEGLLSMTRLDDDLDTIVHTQGRPISPGDEVRIVDTADVEVADGGIGELLTRGPYTLRGYYCAAEHNANAFTPDGFYRSGDLARRTPSGRLIVEGRLKDVVIRGGDKIAAGELEAHLLRIDGIRQAAVVPLPDEYYGERIYAFLVGEPAPLPRLKLALREQGLADFKLPDRVEFTTTLPLTPLGKIDKKVLSAAARDRGISRAWPSSASAEPPSQLDLERTA